MTTQKREVKKLAKLIRDETGVPLAACCIVARHILDHDLWGLEDLPSVKRWCHTLYTNNGCCGCCGGIIDGVVVTGPKGDYRYEN